MGIYNVAIIGIGRIGGALAIALAEKGYEVTQLAARDREKAEKIAQLIEPSPQVISSKELEKVSADIVIITTQDSEISAVVKQLAEKMEHLPVVFHVSGALSSKILQTLRDGGCEVGSIHPLVSISDSQLGAARFKNAYFCIEGDSEAVNIAKQIVADLGGKPFSIETKYKTLYHASAVTACGHLVALVSAAIEMLVKCGLSQQEAQEVLLPLIISTIKNLSVQTPADALTGTFARADVEGMRNHLQALRENSPEILEIYTTLGLRSLKLAEQQGADKEKLEQMNKILAAGN